MSGKIDLTVLENILRIKLMQKQLQYDTIKRIEDDQTLSPDEKLQLLAEVLNPVTKGKV